VKRCADVPTAVPAAPQAIIGGAAGGRGAPFCAFASAAIPAAVRAGHRVDEDQVGTDANGPLRAHVVGRLMIRSRLSAAGGTCSGSST